MFFRAFLLEFALTGETQERERILARFSHRYVQCNSSLTLSEGTACVCVCVCVCVCHMINRPYMCKYVFVCGCVSQIVSTR